jgi:hypothetical protein
MPNDCNEPAKKTPSIGYGCGIRDGARKMARCNVTPCDAMRQRVVRSI